MDWAGNSIGVLKRGTAWPAALIFITIEAGRRQANFTLRRLGRSSKNCDNPVKKGATQVPRGQKNGKRL